VAKKPARVIKVVGYMTIKPNDGAYDEPLAELAEGLAEETLIADMEDLVISEEPVDPKTIGSNKPKKRRSQ
jgi:hypothetical protein